MWVTAVRITNTSITSCVCVCVWLIVLGASSIEIYRLPEALLFRIKNCKHECQITLLAIKMGNGMNKVREATFNYVHID